MVINYPSSSIKNLSVSWAFSLWFVSDEEKRALLGREAEELHKEVREESGIETE
jgi:hypothetical protein